MKVFEATEIAYKNGYEKGKQDGVVHCRECKHYSILCNCRAKGGLNKPTDDSFCSYGERVKKQ